MATARGGHSTFLKYRQLSILKNEKYRHTFVGTFQKKFQKERIVLYFVDF